MQAPELPRKMMELMRLTSVQCAAGRTLPRFVVIVMGTVVLSVLTHTFVGTHLCVWHRTCHMC